MSFFSRLATLFIDIQTRGIGNVNKDVKSLAASFYLVTQSARLIINATSAILERAGEIELKFIKIGNAAEFSASQTKEFSKNLLESASRLKAVPIDDLQDIALAASQAGIKGGPAIQEFTEAVAKAAAVSEQISSSELAKFLLLMEDLFQRGPEVTGRYANALHVLAQEFRTNEFEIVKVAEKIAGAGRVFGLTEAQILALSAALRTVAVTSERSSSFVSRFLRDIQLDPGKFEKVLGLAAGFEGRTQKNPFEALKEVLKALSGQGSNTATVLKELGFSEVRVFTTTQQLTEGLHKLIDAEKASNEAILDTVKTNEDFSKIQSGIAADVNQLSVAWDQLKATLAEDGPFRNIIIVLADLVKLLSDFKLNDDLKFLIDPLNLMGSLDDYRKLHNAAYGGFTGSSPQGLPTAQKKILPKDFDEEGLEKFDKMLKRIESRLARNGTLREKLDEIDDAYDSQVDELQNLHIDPKDRADRIARLRDIGNKQRDQAILDDKEDRIRKEREPRKALADLLATSTQRKELDLIEKFASIKRNLPPDVLAGRGRMLEQAFQQQLNEVRRKQADITDSAELWKKNQLEILNKENELPKLTLQELSKILGVEEKELPRIRAAVEEGMVGRAGP